MFAFSIVFFSMDFLRHCMVLILILGTIVGIMVAMMLIIMSMSVTALMVIVGMMMMVLRWRAYGAFRVNAYVDGNPFHESVYGGCDDDACGVHV